MPDAAPTHRPLRHHTAEADRRAYDQARGSARRRGYDAAWEALRLRILAERPACEAVRPDGTRCRSRTRLNVDHIVSVREAPAWRLEPSNLRVLCQRCHSARTSRDHSWNRRPARPR